MKVSVIVPSLDQARFLRRTLDSVLGQSGAFALQCVVMDGGSQDGSLDVIRQAEREAASLQDVDLLWRSGRDGGQADAINQGLALADGDVLAYLNSDDRYAAGALQRVVEALARAPHAQWLTGYCRIIDEDDRPIHSLVTRYKNTWLRHHHHRSLLALNYVAQPATFWRRSAMDRSEVFDRRLRYCFDYDYWLRLARQSAPLVLRAPLADFRVHSRSKGATEYRQQFREDLEVANRHTSSWPLLAMHRLHNAMIVAAYRLLK